MIQNIIDTLATAAARLETLAYPDAVILPNFRRSIQIDYYSCGAKSVYCILQYFGKRCSTKSIEQQLHTDEDGTDVSNIKRVFRRYHLNCRTLRKPGLRNLKASINDDCPVLVSLYDSEHYAVVYGYSSTHIWIMNSSVDITEDGVGNLRCAVRKDRFKRIWDNRWGLEIAHF
jgi:ABC-type bacteriocin/lantibiotic exporter with double-glycine peptidase domain